MGVYRRTFRPHPRRRLAFGLPGTIRFDAASNSPYEASVSSYNWSHTCSAGQNRGLLVEVSVFAAGTVTGVTYNGVAMTFVRADTTGVYRTEIWRLENPASGANSVAVTLSASLTSVATAVSYTGVDQANMVEASGGATGTGGSPSASATTVSTYAWLFAGLSTANASPSPSDRQRLRASSSGALGSGVAADQGPISPAASTASAWNAVGGLDAWALTVAAIKPFSTVAITGVGAIASAEAFGTPAIRRWLGPGGVASLEAFGTAKTIRWVGPAGVASSQAFGTPKVVRWVGPGGVASAEAFGRPTIVGGIQGISVTGAGAIASAEAFGVPAIRRILAPVAVGSLEAFGTPGAVRWVGPGGIASLAAVGAPKAMRLIGPAGIASAQAFGTPKAVRYVGPLGIASAQAFGTPFLIYKQIVYPGGIGSAEAFGTATVSSVGVLVIGGSADLSDTVLLSVNVTDGRLNVLGISDVSLFDVNETDGL